jgi:hypothetical protein
MSREARTGERDGGHLWFWWSFAVADITLQWHHRWVVSSPTVYEKTLAVSFGNWCCHVLVFCGSKWLLSSVLLRLRVLLVVFHVFHQDVQRGIRFCPL